ncbi:MAG: GntR family transcriptional regulator [Kiritimatiellaeota bacterium]|nr:GntR family transcriptional regulator [Kiritimatiellota bacterium]
MTDSSQPKHLIVFETLRDEIVSEKYTVGKRFPSEQQLVKRFGFSRPTISRALRDLKGAGFLDRRPGSGTYLHPFANASTRYLGVIVPSLGTTEIFTPICNAIATHSQQAGFALVLGDTTSPDPVARAKSSLDLARQYIRQKVAGIFLEPLELIQGYESINQELLRLFAASNIPVVLLDRDIVHFPERSAYDLVGIDNLSAGYRVADHLIRRGAKRILFFARRGSASTVQYRIAGVTDATLNAGIPWSGRNVIIGDPEDTPLVRAMLRKKPDAVICANDATAAQLIRSVAELGVRVPRDLKFASFDDVQYAKLLTPPLTTIHQPCADIGAVAVQTLLQRIKSPATPAREILLHAPLVVRRSCGARKAL